ncbi:MAG: sulfite exporter TauE/SafE family protein [Bacteroidetes bacterium]|nr:sulfite exporter TauE/SafE family protein [Bacteroidota bacterium]
MELWTAFTIGLFGSIHCVGMCGPIVLALPTNEGSRTIVFLSRVLYNLGRIVTYSFFGLVFGLLGDRIVLHGLQQDVSLLLGLFVLLSVIVPMAFKSKLANNIVYKKIVTTISKAFSILSRQKTLRAFFLIGIVNGFLPCGFVYMGIAGAITTGSALTGAAYMALFGLGTFPIMFITSVFGRYISFNLRRKLNKLIPVFAVLLAIVFILRGLNLGIPYLSPKFVPLAEKQEMMCH